MFLRQSTAQTVRFGPFLDSTDGVTAETALTIAQADMQLSKDGAAFAQKNATGNATHDTDGWYSTSLNTTDVNTVGELILQVAVAGALPVWMRFYVVEESVYDQLFASGGAFPANFDDLSITATTGRVDVDSVGGTAQTANDNGADINTILSRVIGTIASGTHNPQSGDAFARLGAPAGASVSADIAALPTDADVNAQCDLALSDFFTSSAQLVDDIWDEVLTGATHNVVNSAGRRLRFLQEAGGYIGAVWLDTINGVAGTTDFENGVDTNPTDTIANANTIAGSVGLSRFNVAPGSSVTFATAQQNQVFSGDGWTLALGGQNIDGSSIIGANVSGTAINNTGRQTFLSCTMNAVTLPANTLVCDGSVLAGTQTIGEAGDYYYDTCFSGIAGGTTPALDFAAVGATNVNFRHYSGGIEIQNMAATDTMSLEGDGQLVINANCTGGSLSLRGNFRITDNSGGAVTITDAANNPSRFDGVEGSTFDTSTDSLEAIRNRGDAAWVTGGGGSLTQILNVQPVIPISIDLANTATVRMGLILTNAVDDLPSTAEITPGTISVDRKAIGGTSWSAVVTDAAMSEQAGMVYFDEVFDTATGYAEGDSIRVTFKSVSVTADTNTHEICDANGIIFQTVIRETMRGTDGANTATPLDAAGIRAAVGLATANLDTQLATIDGNVDSILADTGTDGVVISAATADQIADALLNRDMSAVTVTNTRSPINALRFLRNRWAISGTTLTVYQEDDSTSAWTGVVSTDAAAEPVTGNNPAGGSA